MPHPGGSGRVSPLRREDPPTLGEAVLAGRLEVTDAGIVYAATLRDQPVAVALLVAGAETDSFARARFLDSIDESRADAATSAILAAGDEPDVAPWAAVSAPSWDDGVKAAGALLAPVTLDGHDPVGTVRGPGFRPHWVDRLRPGRWRAWPLPWPSALSAAGRWTFLVSFALVLAIASIALFIAVKLFENQPPAPVGPPFPAPSLPTPTPSPTPTPTPTSPPPPASGSPRTTGTDIPPIV